MVPALALEGASAKSNGINGMCLSVRVYAGIFCQRTHDKA